MVKPSKNAHFLSDLLKNVAEMKPNNEAGFQVSLSSCFKKKVEAFFKPSRGASDSLRRTITKNGDDASSLNREWYRFERGAAFTLAEVLVTLGIIGVVAAMTMSVLVANIQDKVFENQHTKAKNILANGYKKMLADYEVFELSNTLLNTCLTDSCIDAEHSKVFETVESGVGLTNLNLPDKYKDKDGNEFDMVWSNKYIFVTPDGFVYALDKEKFLSDRKYNIYTDINGAKNPNTEKKDLILYTVSDKGTVTEADIQTDQTNQTNPCLQGDGGCDEEHCNALPDCEWTKSEGICECIGITGD